MELNENFLDCGGSCKIVWMGLRNRGVPSVMRMAWFIALLAYSRMKDEEKRNLALRL